MKQAPARPRRYGEVKALLEPLGDHDGGAPAPPDGSGEPVPLSEALAATPTGVVYERRRETLTG